MLPLPTSRSHPLAGGWREELVSVLAGAGFTCALLFGLAYLANSTPPPPPAAIADLRIMTAPLDPPPPPPPVTEVSAPPDVSSPFSGLEVGSSSSSVKIAVVPPDLDALIPRQAEMPRATIDVGRFYTSFRPKMDPIQDFQRVYQPSEVDQRPVRQITTIPRIPDRVRDDAASLSVTLLIVVSEKGEATNVRVARSSGNPQFDAIIVRCVQEEWGFTPAVRKGKRVKCLTEQPYTVQWTAGSPFRI
jgi:TonB family protein